MKKVIALLLSIMVIISLGTLVHAQSKFSESFSIRNGISYGMTKEEVQQVEKSPFANVTDGSFTDGDNLIFRCGHSEEKCSDYLYYKDITLAGHKDVYMSVGFDENDKIIDVTYVFNSGDGQKIFSEMRTNLSNKYDDPIFDENAPFPSESRRVCSKDESVNGVSIEYSISQYSGWLVKYDDCYVEIDLCLHKAKIGTNSSYLPTIGYRLVSFQEFDELKEKVEEYTQTVQNSIENDL